MFFDASRWTVVDLSYFAVPQSRVRCIYTQNFDMPPPDAARTTLASCAFENVVGCARDIRAKHERTLDEPAHTVFSKGRPYLVYADGHRKTVSPAQAAILQGFPMPVVHEDLGKRYEIHRMIDDAVPPPVARRLVRAALGDVRPDDLVVDLFCGLGGFGVGARMAGARNLLAVDYVPQRLALYRRLTGGDAGDATVTTVCADLLLPETWTALYERVTAMRAAAPAESRLHIHASPPCVSVSVANPRRKEREPEGLLFLQHVAAFLARFPDATASAEQAPRLLITFKDAFDGGDA